ncbi:MAG: hypothetical protein HYS17_06860 [Micavibrio aeruginosavorus]|uniref:Dicarboxylate transport domain-containing protein n=1 Tax=Micavibrio aeruginosavorus TaxID=349221 RepID=A0A7T5R0J3_9BACT|nr:MAG: hypothetical protein HYS17_06860 [Micavibrio aeruginosavorus]
MLIRLWNLLGYKTRLAFAGVILAGIVAILASAASPSRIGRTMAASGFSLSQTETAKARPGQLVLGGISLDADGFSMIGSLKATGSLLFPLLGKPRRIEIDNLQLTGEWNEELGLSFAGWSLPPAAWSAWPKVDRFVLGSSVIDLDTPAGALRLSLQGETARHPEKPGQQLFSAHLSGAQHQLVIDARIKGRWSDERGLALESEITEGRINLDQFSASRLSGWLAFETGQQSLVPDISGQFQIGHFSRGDFILNNISLTVDGSLNNPHTLLNAELGGYQASTLLLETQGEKEGLRILANIETRNMEDLITILKEFRTQAETSPFLQEAFMSLLITEGNIDRVKRDLGKDRYDAYTLEIEGLSHDLKGKIIAKSIRDGTVQRQVFSLNPSVAAGGD